MPGFVVIAGVNTAVDGMQILVQKRAGDLMLDEADAVIPTLDPDTA